MRLAQVDLVPLNVEALPSDVDVQEGVAVVVADIGVQDGLPLGVADLHQLLLDVLQVGAGQAEGEQVGHGLTEGTGQLLVGLADDEEREVVRRD